ncbi:DUF6491 family protein [Zhongshania aquimaris]|uniref:Lipoprotein n=1 Tax=Zhongshania aquimaris TaxID=2857107 RepID=A0ABS6VU92_9GAMM|nr:DUF6491 family protein [Zhongshania aquimaris]MBW2941893.1 hypothetical protein [Zhongshania aquimaris]
MNITSLKVGLTIFLSFSLLACGGVKDEQMGLDERIAEYGYRPGENIDQIQAYRISDWTYLDDHHLMFSNGLSDHYLISLKNACSELRSSETLAFKTRTSTLTKFDVVIVPQSGVNKRCSIESISRLTPTD